MPHAVRLAGLGLAALASIGCYAARPLATPEARLDWIRELRGPSPASPVESTAACAAPTESSLIEMALARDPAIAARLGEARVLMAEAEVPLSGAPQLRVSNLRLDRLIDGPERLDLGLRIPFERPGTLDARRDEVLRDADRARAEGDEAALTTRHAVRTTWARLIAAVAMEAALEREVALAEAEVARLTAGSKQREVTLSDLAAAERERLDAAADLGRARSEVARQRAELARLTGCAATPDVALAAGLEAAPEADLAPALAIDRALSEHPRLAQFAARARAADARLYEARAKAWPWLAWAQVGYELDSDHDARAFGFAFGVDLPFLAWGGAFEARAAAERRAVDEVARREADAIVLAIDAARAEVLAQREALAALDGARAALDPKRLEALRQGVAQGFVDPLEVFRLDREVMRLERRRLEIVENLALARARLLFALAR